MTQIELTMTDFEQRALQAIDLRVGFRQAVLGRRTQHLMGRFLPG